MKRRVGANFGLWWVCLTVVVACGGSDEPVPTDDPVAALTEELSYDLPEVNAEAGTLTWMTNTGDTVIPISSVRYLEHRQDSSGRYLLEVVLADGERKLVVEGLESQMDHAANYSKMMRKDLVERLIAE